jgi:D-alanine-D-alanine ligase
MKKNILVIMGGPSAEYEISLRSGTKVVSYLKKDKYTVRALVLDLNGTAFLSQENPTLALNDIENAATSPYFEKMGTLAACSMVLTSCDCAFLALHGSFGEDGIIQGFLQTIGVPYTGSGVYASALAMNKISTKIIYERYGLSTPPFSIIRPAFLWSAEEIEKKHGFPCFVKCPQSGSSRLMGRATDIPSLRALVAQFAPESSEILIETALNGIEFSVPVIQGADGNIRALPPVEIRPRNTAFFDFEAKYSDNGSEEIVPPNRSEAILVTLQKIAQTAHSVLGCKGLTRTDIILSNDTYYVLEINTLPGLTPASLAPKSWASIGGSYEELLDAILQPVLYPEETKKEV